MINFINQNLALICAFIAVGKWLYENKKQRIWETNKYLVEKFKEFENNLSTKQMTKILDYNKGIPYLIGKKQILLNDNIIFKSLETHDKKENFTDLEFSIRNTFDDYFDNLTELILLSKCGLINKKNLHLLLEYYLNIISGKSKYKSKKYINQIKNYLSFYNYDVVLDFLKYNK